MKGLSKEFLAYKKQLRNPNDKELKFQEFIFGAVQRREQHKIETIKRKQEEAKKL